MISQHRQTASHPSLTNAALQVGLNLRKNAPQEGKNRGALHGYRKTVYTSKTVRGECNRQNLGDVNPLGKERKGTASVARAPKSAKAKEAYALSTAKGRSDYSAADGTVLGAEFER